MQASCRGHLSAPELHQSLCVFAAVAIVLVCHVGSIQKDHRLLETLRDVTHNRVMQFGQVTWDDQALYLLFLEENLSELKSYKCLKVC